MTGATPTTQPYVPMRQPGQLRHREGSAAPNEMQMAAELQHLARADGHHGLALARVDVRKPNAQCRSPERPTRGIAVADTYVGDYQLSPASQIKRRQPRVDLFSFNETDAAVDLKLSAEQHLAMVLRLGAAFEKAGLKTRLLIGDLRPAKESSDLSRLPWRMRTRNDSGVRLHFIPGAERTRGKYCAIVRCGGESGIAC